MRWGDGGIDPRCLIVGIRWKRTAASRPYRLTPSGRNTGTQLAADWVGPRATLGALKKRPFLVPAGYGITIPHTTSLTLYPIYPTKYLIRSKSQSHLTFAPSHICLCLNFYFVLANGSGTATHCMKILLNPWHTTETTVEMSTTVQCWQQGYWQRQADRSVGKTRTNCGKRPIRTNTFPISAANKWRQKRVHSTEKTTLIPCSPQTLLPCLRPSLQWDTVLVCWPRSAIFDWSIYRTDKKHGPKHTRIIR